MAEFVRRLKYNELQFLREPDLTDEQTYHRQMRYRLNRHLHSKGIAQGLTVVKSGDKTVIVSAGMAIDGEGREIVLLAAEEVDLAPFNKASITSYLVISFGEQDADGPIPDPNPEIRNRTEEKPEYNLVDVKPIASDIPVWLAEIDFDINGVITDVRDIATLDEIPDSGAKIAKGSVSLENLDDGLQNALILALVPAIDDIDPEGGNTGDPVTITGERFIEPLTVEFTGPGDTRVTGDNIVVVSATEINTNSPAGIVDGKIYVITPFGEAVSSETFFPS